MMEDAPRTEEGKNSYVDFIDCLRQIQQLCPLRDEHTGAKSAGGRLSSAQLAAGARREREHVVQQNDSAACRYGFSGFPCIDLLSRSDSDRLVLVPVQVPRTAPRPF